MLILYTLTFPIIGKPPDVEKPSGAYPFCVKKRNSEDTVPVVQAFHATKYLGKLWLEFDDQGVLINSYGNPILLDSSIPQGMSNSETLHQCKMTTFTTLFFLICCTIFNDNYDNRNTSQFVRYII